MPLCCSASNLPNWAISLVKRLRPLSVRANAFGWPPNIAPFRETIERIFRMSVTSSLASMVPLRELESLLRTLMAFDRLAKA